MSKFSTLLAILMVLSMVLVMTAAAQQHPTQGQVTLNDGFDAHEKFLIASGDVEVIFSGAICVESGDCWKGCDPVDNTCEGYVGELPDYRVEWYGRARPPEFYFVGDGDPIMVIEESRAPEPGTRSFGQSTTYYNDDYANDTTYPGIQIDPKPIQSAGDGWIYTIWIGTKAFGGWTSGVLHVVDSQNYPDYFITGDYEMDGMSHRVININRISEVIFRVEEQTSPWPWEGVGILFGSHFAGYGDFLLSEARMAFDGQLNHDGTLSIDYRFLDEFGQYTNRTDVHDWIPR